MIARPFIGKPGTCTRTSNRHDFSLEPGRNVLDILLDNGMTVIGVGKIKDLFAGRGLSESYPTSSNQEGIQKIAGIGAGGQGDLIFANLLDFDQTYGHLMMPQAMLPPWKNLTRVWESCWNTWGRKIYCLLPLITAMIHHPKY